MTEHTDEFTVLRFEDDDGFATEWEWPADRLLLANGDLVALMRAQHDAAREAWLIAGRPTGQVDDSLNRGQGIKGHYPTGYGPAAQTDSPSVGDS